MIAGPKTRMLLAHRMALSRYYRALAILNKPQPSDSTFLATYRPKGFKVARSR